MGVGGQEREGVIEKRRTRDVLQFLDEKVISNGYDRVRWKKQTNLGHSPKNS